MIRAIALVTITVFGANLGAQGTPCTAGPPTTIGTVNVTFPSIPFSGPLPRTTAEVLEVQCAGIPPIHVQLHTSEPPPGVPVRGTIVFGTGARGVSLFSAETFGAPIMRELQNRGFRIVDRGWITGWFEDPISGRKQSCRYATLLDYIHRTKHTTGVFGALGSSGGAVEIAYALTTWGAGDMLDIAVFTGGPSLARSDLQCPNPPTATWLSQCAALIPPNVMSCTPICNRGAGLAFGMCTKCGPNPTPAELRDDSVLHENAVLDYPRTRVHILLGADDCLESVPSAMLFYSAVTSEKVVEFVPGAGHFIVITQLGLEATVRAFLGRTPNRSGPATIQEQGWPQLGGTLAFDLHGAPSADYFVLMDPVTGFLEFPTFGWFFLSPGFVILGNGRLDPQTGRAIFTIPVPPLQRLTGFEIFGQALVGTDLTNAARFEILP